MYIVTYTDKETEMDMVQKFNSKHSAEVFVDSNYDNIYNINIFDSKDSLDINNSLAKIYWPYKMHEGTSNTDFLANLIEIANEYGFNPIKFDYGSDLANDSRNVIFTIGDGKDYIHNHIYLGEVNFAYTGKYPDMYFIDEELEITFLYTKPNLRVFDKANKTIKDEEIEESKEIILNFIDRLDMERIYTFRLDAIYRNK